MRTIPALSLSPALLVLAFAVALPAAHAQVSANPPAPAPVAAPADPSIELMRNSTIKVWQGDYDTELTRLPPDARAGFGTDISRVNTLLASLLVTKTLAAEARATGVDKDPELQRRIAMEMDRILSQMMQQRLEEQWAKAFDALPDMDKAARERWLTQSDKFKTSDQVQVTHILFEVPAKHRRDEALKLAQDARAKVLAGADMNALARAISEDPSAQRNDGKLDWRGRNELDPQFARAAFALAKPGDLSEPVLSRFGYHVIRLDARRLGTVVPFEQVKASILADMKKAYVEQKRGERLASIRHDPSIVVNEPAVEALIKRPDPELLKRMHEEAAANEAARAAQPKDSPVTKK